MTPQTFRALTILPVALVLVGTVVRPALAQGPLLPHAQTPNQIEVARALDAIRNSPACVCFQDLFDEFDAMNGPGCACDIRRGLNSLTPQSIVGLTSSRMALSWGFEERLFYQLRPGSAEPPQSLIDYVDSPMALGSFSSGMGLDPVGPEAIDPVSPFGIDPVGPCPPEGANCRPYGAVHRRAVQAAAPAVLWAQVFAGPFDSRDPSVLDADLGGVLVGGSLPVSERFSLGLAGGYGHINADGAGTNAEIDSFRLLGYGRYRGDVLYAFGGMGHSWDSYDLAREVTVGSLRQSTSGSANGGELFGFAETGLSIPLNDSVLLQPFFNLTASRFTRDAYIEQPADGIALAIGEQQTESFASRLGGRAAFQRYVGRGTLLRPELRASWRHEYLDTPQSAVARFVGAPNEPFAVLAAGPGRDAAILGTGVTFILSRHCSLGLHYDAFIASEAVAHIGSASAVYAW